MDWIYLILSIYQRLFQTALPLSRAEGSLKRDSLDQPWALWIPLFGWVLVLARSVPAASWLNWRVTGIERLTRPPEDPAVRNARSLLSRRSIIHRSPNDRSRTRR